MTRVLLAVGHGIRSNGTWDPGAVSKDGRWNEQRSGDIIVAEAARCLTLLGATVRSEAFSNDPNYTGTIKAANAWPADIAVELHHDWSGAPEGAFGHWYRADSKALADAIQKAVGNAGFPLRPDWHKRRTDLSFIKSTHMPSVLYECGRIGTGSLDTPEELRAMGRAISRGVAAYLGLKPQPPIEEVDMTDAERDQLARVRIATLANSFEVKAANLRLGALMAKLGIDDPPEVAMLLVKRDADVTNERRRLKL